MTGVSIEKDKELFSNSLKLREIKSSQEELI